MAVPRRSIHEIDSVITSHLRSLSTSPSSHNFRPVALHILAVARPERNTLSNQMEDLDKSISHCTEAILLPPRSWIDHGPMILRTLFLLAGALVQRSMVSKCHLRGQISPLPSRPASSVVPMPTPCSNKNAHGIIGIAGGVESWRRIGDH